MGILEIIPTGSAKFPYPTLHFPTPMYIVGRRLLRRSHNDICKLSTTFPGTAVNRAGDFSKTAFT
jgi:hypothetical protein